MRECPNCGYKDPPYWRHVRFRIFTDCCHLEDFKIMFPDLWQQLELTGDFIHHPYIYHLVKKANIVQRIHIDDSMNGKSWREPEQEKAFKFKHPAQQKLLSVGGKT